MQFNSLIQAGLRPHLRKLQLLGAVVSHRPAAVLLVRVERRVEPAHVAQEVAHG